MADETTSEVVFRTGLLYGPIVAVANVGSVIFWWLVDDGTIPSPTFSFGDTSNSIQVGLMLHPAAAGMLGISIFTMTLLVTLLAGRSTSSKVGGVATGALSGLVAGAFAGVMGAVTSLAVIFLIPPNPQQTMATLAYLSEAQRIFSVGLALFGLALDCCLGAAMGSLGSLVGAERHASLRPEFARWPGGPTIGWTPEVFPFAPYPAQPVYPSRPQQPKASSSTQ